MSTSAIPWRKRSFDSSDSSLENKKPRLNYYFRLKSESPADSEDDDTESVYSFQGRETERVKDTSDTGSQSEYEVEIEYDIASLSDSDGLLVNSSSDSEDIIQDMVLAAAAVCDSSLETFITDAEDSDNSRQDDLSTPPRDFRTCIKCKSQNNNPQLGFCEKCFQDRKTLFPPRPRRHRKPKRNKEKSRSPVKLDALQSCLSGLSSQDSGIGSSQELSALCLDQIVVPQQNVKTADSGEDVKKRKREFSESSLSDGYECNVKRSKKEEKKTVLKEDRVVADKETNGEGGDVKGPLPELKEICIMCNVNPKNSVFLHGHYAHMCCCYRCAMRTWKTLKRCPICKRKVSNVVKVFTT